MSRALELARKKMFSKDWGLREDKLNIMLLMTDGTESSATAVDHPALDHIKALNQSGLTDFSFSTILFSYILSIALSDFDQPLKIYFKYYKGKLQSSMVSFYSVFCKVSW